VTADEFRRLALSLPETSEGAHQRHPDFRVGGKIFATLGPDGEWGMVKLPTDRQASRVSQQPKVFEPFNGAWGRQGATKIHLAFAESETAQIVLIEAWRNVAPRKLVEQHDDE
jgi:hypothetical protein